MKRPLSSSRELWIAVVASVAFHALAGFVFWMAWEHTEIETGETQMEWTWTAPTSEKMTQARPGSSGNGKEQAAASKGQSPQPSETSGSGVDLKNGPPSAAAAPSKEISPTEQTSGGSTGTAPTPAAGPASGTGTAIGGPAIGGTNIGRPTASTPSSTEVSPGHAGPNAGESTGYALVPPKLREHPASRLPSEAVQAGLSGNVLLLVEVLEDGRVGKIAIGRSSGSKLLDESAKENVSHWEFEPAWEPQGKKTVRVLTSIWVRYVKEGS